MAPCIIPSGCLYVCFAAELWRHYHLDNDQAHPTQLFVSLSRLNRMLIKCCAYRTANCCKLNATSKRKGMKGVFKIARELQVIDPPSACHVRDPSQHLQEAAWKKGGPPPWFKGFNQIWGLAAERRSRTLSHLGRGPKVNAGEHLVASPAGAYALLVRQRLARDPRVGFCHGCFVGG